MMIEILIIGFVIPSLVAKQVWDAQLYLRKSTSTVVGVKDTTATPSNTFSASDYLFTSYLLAERYVHLPESQVVRVHRDPLPHSLGAMNNSGYSDKYHNDSLLSSTSNKFYTPSLKSESNTLSNNKNDNHNTSLSSPPTTSDLDDYHDDDSFIRRMCDKVIFYSTFWFTTNGLMQLGCLPVFIQRVVAVGPLWLAAIVLGFSISVLYKSYYMRAFVWFICVIVILAWLFGVFALVASEQFHIITTDVLDELEDRNRICSKAPNHDNEEEWVRSNVRFPNIHGDDDDTSSNNSEDNDDSNTDLLAKLKRLRTNSILKKAKFVKSRADVNMVRRKKSLELRQDKVKRNLAKRLAAKSHEIAAMVGSISSKIRKGSNNSNKINARRASLMEREKAVAMIRANMIHSEEVNFDSDKNKKLDSAALLAQRLK